MEFTSRPVNKSLFVGLVEASMLLALCACGTSTTVPPGVTGSSGGGTTTTTTTSITDVKRFVTAGNNIDFNSRTAGQNDLALNPTTSLPAIAYYDRDAVVSGQATITGALKYAYKDSYGIWNVEVVDANYWVTAAVACGTANAWCVGAPNAAGTGPTGIIRLAFKSDGTPMIAYVFGSSVNTASGFKQVRVAERSSSGTWTISVADSLSTATAAANVANGVDDDMGAGTVSPIKGLTLNIDSSNRPHLTFTVYAQAIASSNIIYAFRDSSGNWSTSTIMSAFSAGTITGLSQGDEQAGAALCTNGALTGALITTHTKMTAAAGVGHPFYINCTTVNASGKCTAWNTLDLTTGCTGNCFSTGAPTMPATSRTDVIIDATTKKPLIAYYTTANPANQVLTQIAPSTCDQNQSTAGAWAATARPVGAANDGVNGYRLYAGSAAANLNFIGYLTSTTAVKMATATGSGLTAWNGPATVETVTVSTGQGVGAAYDSTNDIAYVSYGATPGAAAGSIGNDIKVGLAAAADITAATANSFDLETVDQLNRVFPVASVPMLASALAPNGSVGLTYYFQDPTTAGNGRLYYGVRGGTAASPTFAFTMVNNTMTSSAAGALTGGYPSLAYDGNSDPIIAYYNASTSSGHTPGLEIARSPNSGGSFSIEAVDTGSDSSTDIGQYPSVATSGSSIGVAYYDVTNTSLKFARYTPTTGWRRFKIDGTVASAACGLAVTDSGKYAQLQLTSSGIPVIAYQTNGNSLRLATANKPLTATSGYTWTCISIDNGGNKGSGISFVLDSSDKPYIVNFDSSTGQIYYQTCSASVSACIATGPTAFTTSASVVATSSTSTVSTIPSLRRASNGTLYLAYYNAAFGALSLATSTDGVVWTSSNLDSPPSGVSYTPAIGQYPSMILNSSGYPLIFYRSMENWIRYFSREVL